MRFMLKWQELKLDRLSEIASEMFLGFAYQTHIAREIIYLRKKPSLLDKR